jgi:hypothetical protein
VITTSPWAGFKPVNSKEAKSLVSKDVVGEL